MRDFSNIDSLDMLETIASDCPDCRLCQSRTNVVFGSGDADADVMIVGEGPGQKEDETGVPFVGRSGQLLTKLLAEQNIDRDDVYIANVVKCRPPGNRDPRPDEIDACKPYLRRQIELIDPKVVITLGNFSSKLLLNTTTGITKLRGEAYPWWNRYLVPTFHPAAALRGGERVANDIRVDIATVRSILDGTIEFTPDTDPADSSGNPQPGAIDEQLDLFGSS